MRRASKPTTAARALLVWAGVAAGCQGSESAAELSELAPGPAPAVAIGTIVCDTPACLRSEPGPCPAQARVEAGWLREQATAVLQRDPSVRPPRRGQRAARLGLALHPGPRGWTLTMTLADAPEVAPTTTTAPLLEPSRPAARAALVSAWARTARPRRLAAASNQALRAAMRGVDVELAAAAMQLLGQRRHIAATETILAFLRRQDDPEVLLRGVGTLTAMGDRRAVPTLIDLSWHQEPAFVAQAAFAIGRLGGDLAEAYLVTLAAGHPDAKVAQAAADALGSRGRF